MNVSLTCTSCTSSMARTSCSPRAGISLVKASRARALIHGRDYVVPEDLFALAEDVILHRIRLSYEAVADGYTSQQVLQEILSEVAK